MLRRYNRNDAFAPNRIVEEPARASKPKIPSQAAIQRAVVSSTAIETRVPVAVIERKLVEARRKFAHLKLAR